MREQRTAAIWLVRVNDMRRVLAAYHDLEPALADLGKVPVIVLIEVRRFFVDLCHVPVGDINGCDLERVQVSTQRRRCTTWHRAGHLKRGAVPGCKFCEQWGRVELDGDRLAPRQCWFL
ncbi:hypothetical protein D3C75_952690 [compost metagenome]